MDELIKTGMILKYLNQKDIFNIMKLCKEYNKYVKDHMQNGLKLYFHFCSSIDNFLRTIRYLHLNLYAMNPENAVRYLRITKQPFIIHKYDEFRIGGYWKNDGEYCNVYDFGLDCVIQIRNRRVFYFNLTTLKSTYRIYIHETCIKLSTKDEKQPYLVCGINDPKLSVHLIMILPDHKFLKAVLKYYKYIIKPKEK
jgi:hypothetical protein